jgi:hypothetical protein
MVTMGPREDTTVRNELGVAVGTHRFPNKIHRQRGATGPGAIVGMPAQDPGAVGRCGWVVDMLELKHREPPWSRRGQLVLC